MQGRAEATDETFTGAAAAEIPERAEAPAAASDEYARCQDCGAVLSGAYCSACGQRAHLHRSLSSLAHDVLHGAFHFDGKFWRTLPELCFHPGRLTRRYIHGERTKFVSPMGLFLFTVFAMFAVFSWTPDAAPEAPQADPSGARADGFPLDESIAKIRELQAERSAPDTSQSRRAELDAMIAEQKAWLALMEILAGSGQSGERAATAASDPTLDVNVDLGWPALDRVLSEGVRQARANPRLLLYKLKSNAYKVSWALVPLSIPFVWLLFFWRRDIPLYDHAVFATYSISFMMLLLIVLSLAASLGVSATIWEAALAVIPPIHLYKHLRGAYGLSRAGALVRTVLLLVAAIVVLAIFVALLLAVGMLG